MPVANFAQNIQAPFFPMCRHDMSLAGRKPVPGAPTATVAAATTPATQTASASSSASSGDGQSFWHDVLEVVNPLQHLPVVGTVYRAITGDKIGDVEKVAGDTLYGGPVGLATSLADVAFEKLTGKSFEDTVMGLFHGGGDKATAVAANALKPLPSRITASTGPIPFASAAIPAKAAVPVSSANPTKADAQSVAAQLTQSGDSKTQALMAAMSQNGVDSDLGMRALFAYQKSLGLSSNAAGGADAAP